MNSTLVNTATEVTANRTRSRLGCLQRHFQLSPPLDGHVDVAVTPGLTDTYVFAAEPDTGDILDPSAPLRTIADTDTDAALAALGYAAR